MGQSVIIANEAVFRDKLYFEPLYFGPGLYK